MGNNFDNAGITEYSQVTSGSFDDFFSGEGSVTLQDTSGQGIKFFIGITSDSSLDWGQVKTIKYTNPEGVVIWNKGYYDSNGTLYLSGITASKSGDVFTLDLDIPNGSKYIFNGGGLSSGTYSNFEAYDSDGNNITVTVTPEPVAEKDFDFVEKVMCIGGTGNEVPTLQFYKKGFNLNYSGATPSWQDIILSGNTALTLTNALANGLNYLKLFGDTEQLSETYLDTVTLSGRTEQRNLPSGYTQVEYIKNDANSYIDTGYKANLNTKAVIEFAVDHAQTTGNTGIFGDRVNDNIQAFYMATKSGTLLYAHFDDVARQIINDPSYTPNQKYTSTLSKDGWYLGSTLCATFNGATSFTTENNLLLFRAGTLIASGVSIYKLTLYENDVIVHNYIPAKNSSNVVGMYDTVTNTFLTNVGTFTAGADVTTPSPDTPMDIVCNNGVVKGNTKMLEWNNIVDGYTVNYQTGGIVSNPNRCYLSFFPISIGDNITMFCSTTGKLSSYLIQYSTQSADSFVSSAAFNTETQNGNLYTKTATATVNGYAQVVFVDNKTTAIANNWSVIKNGVSVVGTQEVVTDSLGNTANAERLLAVGDYKDTQEVISGSVTRNIGIKVLNGSENWQTLTGYMSISKTDLGTDSTILPTNSTDIFCTHFQAKTGTFVDGIGSGNSYVNFKYDSLFTTLTQWTQFLAQQYAQGTPVILVYPISSATTESVSGQFLSKSPVTQTAGSISNLPIAVTSSSHTTPTPQQPLQINCNNGVLGIDSQGNITVTGTTETVQIAGENLFNKTTVVSGYRLTNSVNSTYGAGTDFVSANTQFVSALIPVEVGKTYIKNSPVEDVAHRYKTYNSSRMSVRIGNENSVTIQSGEAYIAFCGVLTELDSTTLYDSANIQTATAENLFKVGNYKDEQEILSGAITRNVGILVFDGTEDWSPSGSVNGMFFLPDSGATFALPNTCICSHFSGCSSTITSANMPNMSARCGYERYPHSVYMKNTAFGLNLATWKAYLATQYANGTPVIIVYPLAEPTTETVTGQSLTTQAGTNIVEITQASIDNLGLEVSYKATV